GGRGAWPAATRHRPCGKAPSRSPQRRRASGGLGGSAPRTCSLACCQASWRSPPAPGPIIEESLMSDPPRILVVGAHPDDPDITAGGTAARGCAAGAVVGLVSLTDGSAGHQGQHGPALAARRRAEAEAAGRVIGASYEVLDIPDGELDDRLEYRQRVIRLL